jgi:GxxExxY protein
MCHELHLRNIPFGRQIAVPVEYKGIFLDCGYRLDLPVDDSVIVELKCVDKVLPIHSAQLLTYLKLTGKRVGLILNFQVPVLREGIVRKVL